MKWLRSRTHRLRLMGALLAGWALYAYSLKTGTRIAPDHYEVRRANSGEAFERGTVSPRVDGREGEFEINARWSGLSRTLGYRLQIRVDDCLRSLQLGKQLYSGFEVPYCDYNQDHFVPIARARQTGGVIEVGSTIENKGGPGGVDYALIYSPSALLLFNLLSFAWLCAIFVLLRSLLRKSLVKPAN